MTGEFVGVATGAVYGRLAIELGTACWEALGRVWRRAGGRGGADDVDRQTLLRCVRFDDFVRERMRTCKDKDYAPSTIERYVACLDDFLGYLHDSGTRDICPESVFEYQQARQANRWGNAALRLRLCAVRTVFDKLMGEEVTEGVRHVPRPQEHPPASQEQMLAADRGIRSDRVRFAFAALNAGGLRLSEITHLAARTGSLPLTCKLGSTGMPNLVIMEEPTPGYRWLMRSPRGDRPISARSLRRELRSELRRCGLQGLSSTAIRRADRLPGLSFPKVATKRKGSKAAT